MNGIFYSSIICILGIILLFFKTKTTKHILNTLAILLLSYKTIEYTSYALMLLPYKIPLEYSTFTYFVFSLTVVFRIEKLKTFASFASLISGLGYLISFTILKDQFIQNNGAYLTWLAFVNHSICFLGSLLLMKTHLYRKRDNNSILNFTLLYLIYVAAVNYIVHFPQTYIFIRLLLDGSVLTYVLPNTALNGFDYLLYYLSLFIIYRLLIYIYYGINHLIYSEKGVKPYEYSV